MPSRVRSTFTRLCDHWHPNERVFAPDVIAVLDVDPRKRDSWLVDLEGKGIDFALEILVHGDRRKDMKKNVVRYAGLGIPEYFVFDRRWGKLLGFRLPSLRRPAYTSRYRTARGASSRACSGWI